MSKVAKIPYPEPIPFPRIHRCGYPVLHSLSALGVLGGWLWLCLATRGTWGLTMARWLDPHKVGYGLPIAVFTELFWWAALPLGGIIIFMMAMWHCTGARAHVNQAFPPPQASMGPQPRMVERIILTDDAAAQHGLPGGTIVERIHY